jgi:hypothetical protein
MPDIDFIRADIEHRRRQVQRLRTQRPLKKEQPGHNKGRVLGGRHW